MKLLIDADILVYRSAFSVQYAEYLHDGHWYRRQKDLSAVAEWEEEYAGKWEDTRPILGTLAKAFSNLDNQIESIIRNVDASDYLLFISAPNNYREEVKYPVKYKGNRPEKPTYIGAVKNYLTIKYGPKVKNINPYEADDLIGMYMHHGGYKDIIVSVDKDLKGIPGAYYHLDDQKITTTTLEQACRWFWNQVLTGDRVDSIIGINGIGPKKAEKYLNGIVFNPEDQTNFYEACLEKYIQEFEDNALDMLDANIRLLTIRTTPLEDFPIAF